MRPGVANPRQPGFSLLELLIALAVFLVICGAAFALLGSSQNRYSTESQMLNSFQEARLGLDQIVRDVNDAGYPPPSFTAAPGNPLNFVASSPFAWSQAAGYPNNPCLIGTGGGGTCTTVSGDEAPGDFDLIIETDPNPQDPGCTPNCPVQWIRYQLQGTILMRGMVPKVSTNDPDAAFNGAGAVVPFVQNVVNNSLNFVVPGSAVTVAAQYPTVFPGGNPVPIFSYTCDTGNVPQPCPGAGAYNAPANIRDVVVTLIVVAPALDPTTGLPRLAQLTGRARRINPNQ
jgi:prepilin-type N-terminal cleavage/methylation domain-containing protein